MNKIIKKFLPYIYLFILTIIILNLFLGYFFIDLSVPIKFGGDALSVYSGAKGIFTNQFLPFQIPKNSFLGAPGISILADYPQFDVNLYYIFIKFISFFCSDFIKGVHIYYLLTYVFITFTSYYVFRYFKINSLIAGSCSLLFSFSSYHVLRGVNHILYSSYYMIPLMILTVFWIWSKKPLFFVKHDNKWLLDIKNKKAVITCFVLALGAMSVIYYEYFYLYFIVIATISSYFYRKNIYTVFSSLIMIFFNLIVLFLNAIPYIMYRIQHGVNSEAIVRNFIAAEKYGLKIVQMLLPVDNHFLFASFKEQYNLGKFLINENTSASLGILGVIGFISILFYFLFIRKLNLNLYSKSGVLVFSALLLGTVGSFSSFISFTFCPFMRSYNRISIFILFISLLVFAVLFQMLFRHFIKNHRFLFFIFIMFITLLGIRDMIPMDASLLINYNSNKEYYSQLKVFIKNIESVNPDGAMIFQLPYIVYPESDGTVDLEDYEYLKPYLVSDKLRWSYGAMKGRDVDMWFRSLNGKDFAVIFKEIKKAGFSGVLVSKKAFRKEYRSLLSIILNNYLSKPLFENDEYIYYKL